jgi:hypothetical protein
MNKNTNNSKDPKKNVFKEQWKKVVFKKLATYLNKIVADAGVSRKK